MRTKTKGSVINLEKSISYSAEAIISSTILQENGGFVVLYAFDKGQVLGSHIAPFDALMQVLDGTAEVKIGNETWKIEAGKSVLLPAGEVHSVKGITRFKMLLTMIKN